MQRSEVEKQVNKLKQAIRAEIKKGKYDNGLSMISVCANILYQTNICYMDNDLENFIAEIAEGLALGECTEDDEFGKNSDIILFYDGFGLNDRGLIQIYLKALCKVKKVIYVTYFDRKNKIPDVVDILDSYHCDKFYIKRDKFSILASIRQLKDIVSQVKPGHMFFYSVPDDVVAIPVMFAYKNIIKRYQINLTDHAFWLGSKCIDICVEFRDYGAKISKEYRNIPEEKIFVIPFYPIIHYNRTFQGFPFLIAPGQKVVFSGGALYKTYGCGNKYYEIVDHILANYTNVIFWYAGRGDDTELKKIMCKYPERVYFTVERSDLYQILEHCHFYLSTYPICGGLMFQYSAMAGIVPVTLKNGNISDSFLLDQDEQGIEFSSIDELYEEIDRLMKDTAYVQKRRTQMKQAVISPKVFEEQVRKLVLGEPDNKFKVVYEHIDTTQFRQIYLDRMKAQDINEMLVRANCIKSAIRYYPIRFFRGVLHHTKKILMKYLSLLLVQQHFVKKR